MIVQLGGTVSSMYQTRGVVLTANVSVLRRWLSVIINN